MRELTLFIGTGLAREEFVAVGSVVEPDAEAGVPPCRHRRLRRALEHGDLRRPGPSTEK